MVYTVYACDSKLRVITRVFCLLKNSNISKQLPKVDADHIASYPSIYKCLQFQINARSGSICLQTCTTEYTRRYVSIYQGLEDTPVAYKSLIKIFPLPLTCYYK